jgi:hypothetical protein
LLIIEGIERDQERRSGRVPQIVMRKEERRAMVVRWISPAVAQMRIARQDTE